MSGGKQSSNSSSGVISPYERASAFDQGIRSITSGWTDAQLQKEGVDQKYRSPDYKAPSAFIGTSAHSAYPYTDPGAVSKISAMDPGVARQLNNGDYNSLEQAIYNSSTSGLRNQEDLWRKAADEDLAKRGIFRSGVAAQAQGDITKNLADSYAKAGADATAQRYALQANDLSALNNYQLSRANALNDISTANATNENQWNQSNAAAKNSWNLADLQNRVNTEQFNSQNANAYNLAASKDANAFASDQADKQYNATWRPAEYLAGLWGNTAGNWSVNGSSGWSM